MLSLLSRKLCPLMSLALALGCGKKINDPSTSDVSRTNQTQTTELPSVLVLKIDEVLANSFTYQMPKNAWFNLPQKLNVRKGNSAGKRVKIYYNLLSNGEYEFQCNYKTITINSQMEFENCTSSDGVVIVANTSDLERMDFPMDRGSSIRMQLNSPSQSGLIIEASYLVEWK